MCFAATAHLSSDQPPLECSMAIHDWQLPNWQCSVSCILSHCVVGLRTKILRVWGKEHLLGGLDTSQEKNKGHFSGWVIWENQSWIIGNYSLSTHWQDCIVTRLSVFFSWTKIGLFLGNPASNHFFSLCITHVTFHSRLMSLSSCHMRKSWARETLDWCTKEWAKSHFT